MKIDPTKKIGVWSSYYDQVDKIVIEEDDSWREMTIDDLSDIIVYGIKKGELNNVTRTCSKP